MTFDELDAGFLLGERRGTDIDSQHVTKPEVLADALMHHVLRYSFDADQVIGPSPSVRLRPRERQIDTRAWTQVHRWLCSGF
jgi:hypothetical protein